MEALEVNFLGGVGSGYAPLVGVRVDGELRPLRLSERARLLVAYLALEARAPESAKREEIQRRVFAGRPANEVDEAKDELERSLRESGAGVAFRPYRQDAADKDSLDLRGRLSLREPVRCDLTDLLAGFAAGRVSEAAERIAEIRRCQGDCRPLELVGLERDGSLQPEESWYGDRAERFTRLMLEHRHAIEHAQAAATAPAAVGPPAGRGPLGTGAREEGAAGRGLLGRPLALAGALGATVLVLVAGILAVVTLGEPEPKACPSTMTVPSEADLAASRVPPSARGAARPLEPIVVRSRPRSLAVSSEGVWVAQSTDGSVWLIDPRIERPVGEPIPVGGKPFSLAVAEDVIWVTREDGKLVAIDRDTRTLRPEVYTYGAESAEVALGAGSVWVNNYADHFMGMISRLDPCSGEIDRIEVGERANTVKFAYGSVWVSDSVEQALHRVDPATGRVTDILLPVGDPQDVGAGGGYVWPVSYGPKRVVRVDPKTNRVVGRPIEIGAGAAGAVFAGGALWLPNYEGDSVTRVELATLSSEPHAVRVGVSPTDIAAGFGRLWVPDNDSEPPTVTPVEP